MSERTGDIHRDMHPIDTRPIAAFLLQKEIGDEWFADWRNDHYGSVPVMENMAEFETVDVTDEQTEHRDGEGEQGDASGSH